MPVNAAGNAKDRSRVIAILRARASIELTTTDFCGLSYENPFEGVALESGEFQTPRQRLRLFLVTPLAVLLLLVLALFVPPMYLDYRIQLFRRRQEIRRNIRQKLAQLEAGRFPATLAGLWRWGGPNGNHLGEDTRREVLRSWLLILYGPRLDPDGMIDEALERSRNHHAESRRALSTVGVRCVLFAPTDYLDAAVDDLSDVLGPWCAPEIWGAGLVGHP